MAARQHRRRDRSRRVLPDRLQERLTDHRPRYTLSRPGGTKSGRRGEQPWWPSQIDLTETVYEGVPVRRILPGVSGWEPEDRPKPTIGGNAAATLRELQEVRRAVVAARKLRVDLRAFMDASSPAWAAYTADHGVPGHGRRNTVLDRLDSTIARLCWGKSST